VKWLFDTNVVSENIRQRPDSRVLDWISSLNREQVTISVVTLAEILEGLANAPEGRGRDRLARWIETEIRPSFVPRMLPLSPEVLVDWLSLGRRLRARGRPQAAPDMLIAATARVHRLTIASRNAQDFAGTGVTVFDPWTGKTHRTAET
jgi:predicted nucleic acid-binding protein